MDLGVQNPWRIYAISHHWLQSPLAVRDGTPTQGISSHSAARPPSPKWNLALISILIKNKACFTQDLGNPGIHFITMQTTDGRRLGIYVLQTRPWLFLQFGSNTSPMINPSSYPSFPHPHLLSPRPPPFPHTSPHPPHSGNILGLLQLSFGYSPSQLQALLCITLPSQILEHLTSPF